MTGIDKDKLAEWVKRDLDATIYFLSLIQHEEEIRNKVIDAIYAYAEKVEEEVKEVNS